MREVQPGLWHWEASHPDWKPAADWGPVVWSYAIDDGDRLLLFDPVAQPSLVDELAAGREPVDVLTCPWHGATPRGSSSSSARRSTCPHRAALERALS